MSDYLALQDYIPESQLVVPTTDVRRARFPVIDAHNHLSQLGECCEDANRRLLHPRQLFDKLDEHNIHGIVDADGFVSSRLEPALASYKHAYPGRVAVLAHLDWSCCREPGWPDALRRQLERAIALGADGLKVSKALGLSVRDESAQLVSLDDHRLDAVWETAGSAGVPVLIHVADPVAFFSPADRHNERWDELHACPGWSWYGPGRPTFRELIEALISLVERHPTTTFQTAHVGCYAENLGFVADQLLRPHPNVYTDISERIAELGRQPYTARGFCIEFQDRILFGTDRPPLGPWYPYYFRFLETYDECFLPGPENPPRQGRWGIYGLGLPDDVLAKVYHLNAERLYRSLRCQSDP